MCRESVHLKDIESQDHQEYRSHHHESRFTRKSSRMSSTVQSPEKNSQADDIVAPSPDYHDPVEALKAVKAGKADEVDIAARILAENFDNAGTEPWTKQEDKSLMRKVDWRLIPIVSQVN
jgi:ribonuclease D